MQYVSHTKKRFQLYSKVVRRDWSLSTEERILKVILTRFSNTDPWEEKETMAERLMRMIDASDCEEAMLRRLDEAGL